MHTSFKPLDIAFLVVVATILLGAAELRSIMHVQRHALAVQIAQVLLSPFR